jgi:hypothetical protein
LIQDFPEPTDSFEARKQYKSLRKLHRKLIASVGIFETDASSS